MKNAAVTLRVSPRAKRWRLSVDTEARVVLSVPVRFSSTQVEAILSRYAGWIDQQCQRQKAAQKEAEAIYLAHPDQLPLLGEWIAYPAGSIEQFYRREAKRFFTQTSQHFADQLGCVIGRVSVRDQKSRWGSCSRGGNLSYSWRLVKAPLFVARYVAAHECAHLVHPNHSASFWHLAAKLAPDHQEARVWLKYHAGFLRSDPWSRDD